MPMIYSTHHTQNLTKYKTLSITRKHKHKHKHKLSPINQNHKLHFTYKPKTHCTIFYNPKILRST